MMPAKTDDPTDEWVFTVKSEVRITLMTSNAEVKELAKRAVIKKYNQTVSQYSNSWDVEPLMIDSLTAYIVRGTHSPIEGVYPYTAVHPNQNLMEFRFFCSSKERATEVVHDIKDNVYGIEVAFQFSGVKTQTKRNAQSLCELGRDSICVPSFNCISAQGGTSHSSSDRLSNTTNLFAVIGVSFGAGDGETTFNVPDFRGRVPLGVDKLGLHIVHATHIGKVGGKVSHVLMQARLEARVHESGSRYNQTNRQHVHNYNGSEYDYEARKGSDGLGSGLWGMHQEDSGSNKNNRSHTSVRNYTLLSIKASGDHSPSIEGSTALAQKHQSFSIMPPYQTIDYIIFTGDHCTNGTNMALKPTVASTSTSPDNSGDYHAPCESNMDCRANLVCNKTSTPSFCSCESHYKYYPSVRKCRGYPGAVCDRATAECVDNAECRDEACECSRQFVPDENKKFDPCPAQTPNPARIRYPGNCRRFIDCQQKSKTECPEMTLFNLRTQLCDYPRNVFDCR
ncbi:unnamed protein product [Rotaria sp. Silwood1]|nr:unnamed protein product [Rotaria sp. Silwood1]